MSAPIRQRHLFIIDAAEQSKWIEQYYELDKSETTLRISDFRSAREDRITIAAEKLSPELKKLLEAGPSQLQVAFSSPTAFKRQLPVKTVQEPGLRVDSSLDGVWHVVGAENGENARGNSGGDIVGEAIRLLVGDSVSVNSSAIIETPNWRSFHDPQLAQFEIGADSEIAKYISPAEIKYADSVAIRWGIVPATVAGTQVHKVSELVVDVFWANRRQLSKQVKYTEITNPDPRPKTSNDDLSLDDNEQDVGKSSRQVEVGLLSVNRDYQTDSQEYPLSGLIRRLDPGESFNQVLFLVSSSQRYVENSYLNAEFQTPYGLHPHHKLTISNFEPMNQTACKLYAKYSIPNTLFVDKYQLQDLEQPSGATPPRGKLIGVWGETDLEAPVWGVSGWGSEALVEIYPRPTTTDESDFEFSLPLHLRYEAPANEMTQVSREMPWPAVFWACEADKESYSGEYRDLGYESLFPQNTAFHHYQARPRTNLQSPFLVPVAPQQYFSTVQIATIVTVVAGFVWLLFKTVSANTRAKPESGQTPKNKNPKADTKLKAQ